MKVRKGKSKAEGKSVYESIKLYGFPHALLGWCYDCMSILSDNCGKKVDNSIQEWLIGKQ